METKEGNNLEFKEEISRSFLKTVCAFANYHNGRIIFGQDDHGMIKGIQNTREESLRIENMINDSIVPVPDYSIEINEIENTEIIILHVKKGKDTPYSCNGKIYRRADTATVEVDRFELRRLALEGINIDYENVKAFSQNLSFNALEVWLKEETGITKMSLDILKTLNLYNKDGYYNVAGELFADQNDRMFSGIDIVRFGKSINQILYRETISKKSLLTQYSRAIEIFEQYYQFEEIQGFDRIKIELIPKEAFRESLANAIVHRVWDINSYVQIAMFEDKVEINFPGGLPAELSKDEYLLGNVSVLRNPIIAGVFYRLNIIEQFGTGITRIKKEYAHSLSKPVFQVSENRIRIQLPVIKQRHDDLSKDDLLIYNLLKKEAALTRNQIEQKTGFSKAKTIRILNKLLGKSLLIKEGNGAAVVYRVE